MHSKFAQISAIFPMVLNELCIGLAYGWVSPSIKYLQTLNNDLYLNKEEISWVASLHELGRFTGPIVATFLSRILGRKQLLTITALLNVLSWTGISFTRSVWILYACRYIIGIAVGFSDVISCIYIGEIVTADIRGRSLSAIHATCLFGVLLSYILGTYLSYSSHAVFVLTVSALDLLSCTLLVETPHYLITVKKEETAKTNLAKVRGDRREIQTEFDEIKRFLLEKNSDKIKFADVVKDRINVRIFCLIISISVLGYMTGYFTISYYSNIIFPPNELLNSNQFTILFGASQFVSVAISSALIESYGRRFLLLTFALCTTLLHTTTAVLYFCKETLAIEVTGLSWLIFATTTLYTAFFTFGCSPVNFSLRSEMFPHQLKSYGAALTVLIPAATVFLETKIFMTITAVFGIYVNFLLYAASAITVLLIVYFKLPETKGKTLAEIQAHFRNER